MAQRTIDRRSRRQKRAGLWLLCLSASALIPLNFDFPGTSTWIPWLILPVIIVLVAHRWMKDEGGVPVLSYHSVSSDQDWLAWAAFTSVTPEVFDRQMRTLKTMGCNVISTAELIKARRENTKLPDKPVAIHFDDGYLDNWTAAYPILRRHGARATVFVSLDFIEDGQKSRPNIEDVGAGGVKETDLEWKGYLNWAELKAMDSSGVFDVQSHGTDHARVRTGPAVVDQLTPANWRKYDWIQWAAMDGNKSGWHQHDDPPYVPYGTNVYENGPALASLAWRDGVPESQAEYEERVRGVLAHSRSALGSALQKEIGVFGWPFNSATPAARRIAEETGYLATTGGRRENRLEEDPRVISRISAHERALGWRWDWLDCFVLEKTVCMCQGDYYCYLPLLAVKILSIVTKPLAGGRRQ